MLRLRTLAWLAVLLLPCCTSAQTFNTMINNGPSSNRVDLVFVGDGYTTTDISNNTYVNHINSYLGHMFANSSNNEPFYRYRNYFNVHRVNVVSAESGADIPPLNIFRNTALDASYFYDGVTDRLLYFNENKANTAITNALSGAGFTAELKMGTVNDTRYGGGGGNYGVYAGGNSLANEIALHEIGHSFAGLADEYGGNAGAYPFGEPSQVNLTKDPTGAKWARWLGYNQPGIGVIGAYQGGGYYDQGVYRPSNDSKMRNLNRFFDVISREAFILRIYDFVNPLDSYTNNAVTLTDPTLFVARIDASLINLQWFVDGLLVTGANADSFNPRDFGYGPGAHTVRVRAYDPTAFDAINGWVRYRETDLEQNVTWNIMLTAVPEPATWAMLGLVSLGGYSFCRRNRRLHRQMMGKRVA